MASSILTVTRQATQKPKAASGSSGIVTTTTTGALAAKIIEWQKFSKAHPGIDLAAWPDKAGMKMYAPVQLKITNVGYMYGNYNEGVLGFGNYVYAVDTSGDKWIFGHLEQPANLKPGQVLSAGDFLGLMGSTGYSSGPHLHLEIHNPQGTPVDPDIFLPANKIDVMSIFLGNGAASNMANKSQADIQANKTLTTGSGLSVPASGYTLPANGAGVASAPSTLLGAVLAAAGGTSVNTGTVAKESTPASSDSSGYGNLVTGFNFDKIGAELKGYLSRVAVVGGGVGLIMLGLLIIVIMGLMPIAGPAVKTAIKAAV